MRQQELPKYRRSIDACDVEDRSSLERFRLKRLEWITLLGYEPEHSVASQLSSLLWQDAIFHLFNEMRRLANPAGSSFMIAPVLAEALDTGYITSMVLGISRLTDRQSSDPAKGVVSIQRVLDDIKSHRQLVTRESYVCFDGLRYDQKSIPWPWERGIAPGATEWIEIGGPLDRDSPRCLHDIFDRLSGVHPLKRQRTDRIGDDAFKAIEILLLDPSVKKFRDLRNKFVAHAADERSRSKVALAGFSVSMADVEQALRSLLSAHHKLQTDFLWNSGAGYMPTAQFDVLEGLADGLTEEVRNHLSEFWERLVHSRETWHESATASD